MRILIDLQGAQSTSRFRGIGRYSLTLALAMARNAGEHEIWLALNSIFPNSILSIRNTFEGLIPAERIRIFEVPIPLAEIKSSNTWRVRSAEILREHFLQQLKPDVVHVASLFEGYQDDAVTSVGVYASNLCTAVTLYDLIPLINQRDYLVNDTHRDYYLRKLESLKNADLLLSISKQSRSDAIEILKIPQNKIVNISAAADERFLKKTLTTERIHQLKKHYGIQRNIVMYAPGGFDERKNFENLISAYSMLSTALRDNHQLIIVGDIDSERALHIKKLAVKAGLAKDELVLTSYLTDEELVDFYNMTTLFVFPSKNEGFGLPVLEAMSCGAPVIGSNNTSIAEVISLPEALFDPYSPQDISKKIADVLNDQSFRERLVNYGLSRAKNFSWDECAKRSISALEAFVHAKRGTLNSKITLKTIPELLQSIVEINIAKSPNDQDLVQVAASLAFNTGHVLQRQLLLDISVIVHGDAKSGIQRVVRSLLHELIKNPPKGMHVRLIYFDVNCYKYASAFAATFFDTAIQEATDEVVDFYQDDIYLALDLNAHLTASVHDFHMYLQCRGIKLYFIVYDILLVQHPEWWPKGTSEIFEAWLRSISEVGTGLICISETVAEEVREWIKRNTLKRLFSQTVSSFHLGADIGIGKPSNDIPVDSQRILDSINVTPSFLIVGTIEPRKGHAQTLAAFELIWAKGININLIIVGKRGWLVENLVDELIRHSEFNKRLFWLDGISDEYLDKIYEASTCLILPSQGEGFGLPLIEAAQHKKPIIARELPVFREVAGDNVLYFRGLDPYELASVIIEWLDLYTKNFHPKSENIRYLTWSESALQLKKILK